MAVPVANGHTDLMADAARGFADVILRTGGTLRLRPPVRVRRRGRPRLPARAVGAESHLAASTAFRHSGPRRSSRSWTPDWRDRGGLIATMSDDGRGEQVVALANYVRLRDPARAEVAFAVADALQGQG